MFLRLMNGAIKLKGNSVLNLKTLYEKFIMNSPLLIAEYIELFDVASRT